MTTKIDYASPDCKSAGLGYRIVLALQVLALIVSVVFAAIACAVASDVYAPMLAMMAGVPFSLIEAAICVIPGQWYVRRNRSHLTVRQARALHVLSIVPPIIAFAGTALLLFAPHTRGSAS